jgi:hypothetical protein
MYNAVLELKLLALTANLIDLHLCDNTIIAYRLNMNRTLGKSVAFIKGRQTPL